MRLPPVLRLVVAWGTLALAPLRGSAEGPPDPEIGYVFPAGGRAGETIDVKLGIDEWTPDLQYFIHGGDEGKARVQLHVLGPAGPLLLPERPHVGGKKAYNPPPLPREVPARFVIPAGTPPGLVRWQVANANGSSRVGTFVVSTGRELIEDEERSGSQAVGALPVAVSGRLRRNEQIDRYLVRRTTRGPVTCELWARRLGSPFHGVIEVRGPSGILITDAADTQGCDAACSLLAEANVDYEVSVHDLDFLGNRAFIYRLDVSDSPRIVAATPVIDSGGGSSAVQFFGFGITAAGKGLEHLTHKVNFPTDAARGSFEYRLATPFGPAPAVLIPAPRGLVRGPAPATHGWPSETPIRLPARVRTEFSASGRIHRYRFDAKKGDWLVIAAKSLVAGPPVDLSLAVLAADGKELARNDDLPGTTDAGLEFLAPADGAYVAAVSDLSDGGELPHIYDFTVERAARDFSLEVPQRIAVVVGDKAELAVKVERTGGFAGPIQLKIDGLPEGVRASRDPKELTVPGDKSEAKLTLVCHKTAPASAALVRVTGSAQIDGRAVMRTAACKCDGPAGLIPAGRIDRCLLAATLKPRVRIWPVESDERTVNRGTVHLAELGIERLEGFDGDVFLQLESRQPNKFRQGVLGPDIVVPPGQDRVLYPCFVNEELETVDAYRVSVNALARVPDARGHEHWLVSAMRSTVSVALTVEEEA